MRFSKTLFLGTLFATSMARAVIVEFEGHGTYLVQTGSWPSYTNHQVPFTVTFSYDSGAPIVDAFATQKSFAGLSLGLTIYNLDGSVMFSHTQTTGVGIVMDNALNGGTTDGLTVTTGFFTEAQSLALPRFTAYGSEYRVTNFSFQLEKNSGGLFTDGEFILPTSPTFMGDDLDIYNRKHAKVYIWNGSRDIQAFDNPLNTLGAPSPIPEPSTWAAVAGAMALGVVVWRRRAAKPISG